MERRLLLAKELLNPDDSVLIVTIDEKEYLRLGLLLEQIFPEARIQMVTIVINPQGVARADEFSRVDEYIFFVLLGDAARRDRRSTCFASDDRQERTHGETSAGSLLRDRRRVRPRRHRPNQFYPIYRRPQTAAIRSSRRALR